MDWTAALEMQVARTGHTRLRDLCSDANPDAAQRDAYRALVVRQATAPPPEPPGLIRKAANFAGAVVNHVAAGLPTLSTEETNARLAVCAPCEFRAAGSCNLCGCNLAVKANWREQACPQGKWPTLN